MTIKLNHHKDASKLLCVRNNQKIDELLTAHPYKINWNSSNQRVIIMLRQYVC